ncbi:GNAT family N-acetyltransferase [Texcoconibacillus texcoconensis]|uniref:Ribosomal-protein-alanine N-acetyltransferase n=1 Tax=Texcoconibacillus texcoconensis TaxID=1095777 RepID=A0A840QR75_9BACI|nr:GNAT family protein [Texcoconibacillus texcoconensis]MBB5173865.1 ribosomal-protein-alanine N-acetyltransferase [Texcoconibacillus texcoconensis]
MNENTKTIHFQTENFIFRELNVDDKHDIYRLFSDPQVTKFDYSEPIKTMQEAETFIDIAQQSYQNPHYIIWGAEHIETGKLIGTCGFKNWNRTSQHAEIGGNLSRELWGNGYATEAMNAIIKHAFTTMNLNKICATTNEQNTTALAILNKYGFKHEGTLREHQKLNAKFHDVLIYSLLKRDSPASLD